MSSFPGVLIQMGLRSSAVVGGALMVALFATIATPIKAQDAATDGTPTPKPVGTTKEVSSFWSRPNASGDWWGARSELAQSGINLRL